uniref:Uncharacterized protein n=1 Tax=Steinernema glaseri TaxID=37863 RepID=A0A1I8AAX5_9BILA
MPFWDDFRSSGRHFSRVRSRCCNRIACENWTSPIGQRAIGAEAVRYAYPSLALLNVHVPSYNGSSPLQGPLLCVTIAPMNTIGYSLLLLALVFGVRSLRTRELFGKRALVLEQLLPLGRKRGGRELFGKRSESSSPQWFGRESRRSRELFGKRSAPLAMDMPDYHDMELNDRLLGLPEPSMEYTEPADFGVSMRGKRRSRELLGKRSSGGSGTYELSEDEFASLLSAIRRDRRARGNELLG